MALPGDVTTFTLTFGPYTDGQGTPALAGTTAKLFPVDPSTNRRLRVDHAASGQRIVPVDVTVTILDDGTAAVAGLPHTGQAPLTPVGWAWRVEWNLTSNNPAHPGNLTFAVPSGAVIDFDALVPADTVPPVSLTSPTVFSVAGFTGTVTATQVATGLDAAGNRLSDAELRAALDAKTHVVVNPDGSADYATLAEAFAAHPAGGVRIELVAGNHDLAAPLAAVGIENVEIHGQGRAATTVTCSAGFIAASGNADGWTVRDMRIVHATGTNTDDGISVDYPRRWSVRHCNFQGFGGSSVRYRGGIHSQVEFCYILAKDSTNINGLAGVHIEKSASGTVATMIRTRGNYIGSGKQYGLLFDSATVGCSSVGDAAELCDTGMRFVVSGIVIESPYTEANRVNGIELHDSTATLIGRFRDEPVVTWLNVAAAERRVARLHSSALNPGKAIVFGGSTAGSNPDTSPSQRWGTGSPEGVVTGVVGSIWFRTDGGDSTTVYVKETGTGNTGWVAHGAGLTGDALDLVRNNSAAALHTVARESVQAANAVTAGTLHMTLFTPAQALMVTKIGCLTGAAWAGSTLTRVGLYLINADGTATLVAASASDPTLFQVANTIYRVPLAAVNGLPANYALVAGQRYATAILGVGITAGQLRGASLLSVLASELPRVSATGGTGLTDLPAGPVTLASSGLMNWSALYS